MKFTKNDIEFFIYQEVYNYHQKYIGLKTDEEWEKAVDEANELAKKYKNNRFLIELLVVVQRELKHGKK